MRRRRAADFSVIKSVGANSERRAGGDYTGPRQGRPRRGRFARRVSEHRVGSNWESLTVMNP